MFTSESYVITRVYHRVVLIHFATVGGGGYFARFKIRRLREKRRKSYFFRHEFRQDSDAVTSRDAAALTALDGRSNALARLLNRKKLRASSERVLRRRTPTTVRRSRGRPFNLQNGAPQKCVLVVAAAVVTCGLRARPPMRIARVQRF